MKIMTLLGTRPEIIRLSRIIPAFDAVCDHIVVHTGQNYDHNLNELFFQELELRKPDEVLGAKGSFGEQIGIVLDGVERILRKEKPDRFLVLGDTNSGLGAIAAKRMEVPVFHMEAGNRCYDDRVPEEINRRIIDHSSDVLLTYTEGSRRNLLGEGIPPNRIFVTGNPIYEVICHYEDQIADSKILSILDLQEKQYILVTMHRAENVDIRERIQGMATALINLQRKYNMPVIISTHPRTKKRLQEFGIDVDQVGVRFLRPFGFFDFIHLEQSAYCVLSDSGTVQEECCIFGTPTVTMRDVTERPETLECGSNILSGTDPAMIEHCMEVALAHGNASWKPPAEYLAESVSEVVRRITTGHILNNGGL